jgi:response regulator RpfG family c-di-GMP phosphodiesterase
VREHPKLDQPKALDILVTEVQAFQKVAVTDLVVLEIKMPDNTTTDLVVKLADFNKVAPNMDDILAKARGTKGRLPGSRVG